jgi:D-alanyl-D-alanine carboxypeptidase/D-alanyl-D-alanine-endopeptidase (penicillin-binding protein 4)
VITVSGNPGLNRTRTVYVAMTDPALICAGTLANRLRAGGVEVEGGIGVRRIPPTSRVLLAKRRTLVEFCSVVNKRSHNYFAEQVFKVVGGQYGGKTNTAEVAKQAMLTTLDSLKVPRRGCVFNDGSGLSRRNLVSAATETELLRAISRRKYAGEYYSTLAIAGVDGTIRGRMIGTPAENNVHAKTGTLRNTSALAGYVTTLDGERWCFSVISNGPYVRNFKATENRLATLLASFSYGGSTWSPPDNAPLPKLQDKTLKGLDPELESELELELELEPAPDTVVLPEDPPYEAGEKQGKPKP